MARLECATEGHPAPQSSWQKGGGTDFPADNVFFIANVKLEDMGIYSCMALQVLYCFEQLCFIEPNLDLKQKK
jgi:hypothetical protein